jgi:nucleoside-diphosphate-sugar epimerase
MKVLVTGARGFIGRACVFALEARGFEVLAPSSRELNLLDEATVRAYLAKTRPTHLLHAAWRAVHSDVMRSADNFAWLKASLSLVEAFHAAGGARAACLGSCAEYDWSYGLCRTGITPLKPATAYGAAKHALHVAAESCAKAASLSFVWPRLFFVYGPGEHETRLSVFILKSLLQGQPAALTHGRQIRDYLYVRDVGEGIVAALLSSHQGEIDIASGEPLALREIALEIGRQTGRTDLLRFGAKPAPAQDVSVVLSDTAHARAHLDWAPRTRLDEGIAEMIAWGRTAFAA